VHKIQTEHKAQTISSYRDLEVRTTEFAKRVIRLCKALPYNEINRRLIGQIVRSAGSIGANYREANEALSKKDFLYRVRVSRKEAKETSHWLELIAEANQDMTERMHDLHKEVLEFRKIFSAIINKSSRT
jgi:four helix bundle protein